MHKLKSHLSTEFSSQKIGRLGEDLALRFLQQKGYQPLDRNYHIRGGEVDLIMRKNGILIFVEVKSRSSVKFGRGQEAFTYQKRAKLLRTILHYLQERKLQTAWQLDLVEIQLMPNKASAQVAHYQNILLV